MFTFFDDPQSWLATMVRTRVRMWLTLAVFSANFVLIAWAASNNGFISGVAAALSPMVILAFVLDASNRVYVRAQPKGPSAT